MNYKVKKEVEKYIKRFNLNCSIEEFKDKADWWWISWTQTLSEDFIREFKDYVNWANTYCVQKLSKKFIKEFKKNGSKYATKRFAR